MIIVLNLIYFIIKSPTVKASPNLALIITIYVRLDIEYLYYNTLQFMFN